MGILPAVLIVFAVVVGLTTLVFGVVCLSFFQVWVQSRASGVGVPFRQLLGMKLRGLNPKFVMHNQITLAKAGVDVEVDSLEAHILAGGNLAGVVDATISSQKAGLGFGFLRIAAIDLAGRDVVDAVRICVNPKVLVCPPRDSDKIMGVARDGIRLNAKVMVTVRTNLERLVGGANEETVIARVGEGIVSAIGNAENHKAILEAPEFISRYILSRGLDSGTSFEIVSIDISDVEVVDNVGARLREAQADADQQVAEARAEMRRAMAAAHEREMRAKVEEMNVQLTAAQATVPQAMARAYNDGNIWRSSVPPRAGFGRQLWDSLDSI